VSEGSKLDGAAAPTAAQVGRARLKADDKFVRGKNGRLFLANDANRVLTQHSGEVRYSDDEVSAWRRTLENRAAWLQHTAGAAYLHVVPPNAHSVFPEDLPDDLHSAPSRPIHQLLSHLDETGSFARVVYPLAELVAAKGGELPVYPKTDTHWTDYGQYLVYRLVMDEVRRHVSVDVVPRSAVIFNKVEETGDLGYKTDPPETSHHVWGSVRNSGARLVFDNCVSNTGSIVVTESDAATEARCLVLGDSYAWGMLTFLAPVFRRMMFAQTAALDYELAEEERPDVVISVLNERFMIIRPNDPGAPTTREVAAWKLDTGVVRPRLAVWPDA
jgi:hypothetical protein